MPKKLVIVLTDNGAVYWGEPIKSYDACITLQHVQCKEEKLFQTQKGRLSIPLGRILELIELDDSFSPIHAVYQEIERKYSNFQANDKDDPSIADDWLLCNQ